MLNKTELEIDIFWYKILWQSLIASRTHISSSLSLSFESDFSMAYYGKYYYINNSFSFSTDYRNTIKYKLKRIHFSYYFSSFEVIPTRSMYFWIHDPNFFILVANQDVIPFAKVLMKPNGIKALWVMIRPVFYVNMDREG